MKRLLHILISGIIAIVSLAIAPTAPVSAMQAHDNSQHSMSQHCSTLCNSVGIKKTDDSDIQHIKEDDEPTPPYYLQFQSARTGIRVDTVIHSREKDDVRTNVPIYRLCCVIRL